MLHRFLHDLGAACSACNDMRFKIGAVRNFAFHTFSAVGEVSFGAGLRRWLETVKDHIAASLRHEVRNARHEPLQSPEFRGFCE